jgi:glycosyltransferase involved in cell wall biosynthesis
VKKILLIHQGAELYGSDRSLLNVLDALKNDYVIEVWLPYDGELCKRIAERNINYQIKNLSILRLVDVKKGNISFLKKLIVNWRSFKNEAESFDLVLLNTIVCFNFIIPLTIPKIVYVREIKGKVTSLVFSFLFYICDSFLFFNSKSTASHYSYKKSKGKVITNAINDQFTDEIHSMYSETGKKMNLLFIGRIIEWKGLHLLIDALGLLKEEVPNFKFTLNIVGDIYEGYDNYLKKIKLQVEQNNLNEAITFKGFVKNPENEFLNSDIVVVPSEEPEPFGRVAVEAMMFKKVVVVADHGGLGEIVEDEINGFKFKPTSVISLKDTIIKIISGKFDLKLISENARKKYLKHYHTSIYKESLLKNMDSILSENEVV